MYSQDMTTTEMAIYAKDMLSAQGVKLTDECNAALIARADRLRELTGEDRKFPVSIAVFTFHEARIGSMTYMR